MNMKYFYALGLSLFAITQLEAIAYRKSTAGFEKSAAKAGADFAARNPGTGEDDIRRFCSNKYPIILKSGMMDEIATRQQTACILGGKEALDDSEDVIEELTD